MIKETDFAQWLENDVTKEMFKLIELIRDTLREEIEMYGCPEDVIKRKLGSIGMCNRILNINFEDDFKEEADEEEDEKDV